MLDWILKNKEWIFSGVGVAISSAILSGLIWLGILLYNRRRRRALPPVSSGVAPVPAPQTAQSESGPLSQEPKVYLQEQSPNEVVARIKTFRPLERELVTNQSYIGHWVRWSDTILGIEEFSSFPTGGLTVTVGGSSSIFARLQFLLTERHLVEALQEGDLISYDAKISKVFDPNVYLTDVNVTQPEERSVVNVTPEDLTRFFEGHTIMQASILVADFINKWMQLSGPLGNVSEFTSLSAVTFADRLVSRASVNMYFRKRSWVDRLSILNRGDRITVLGRITRVEANVLSLDNCELV